MLLSLLLSNTVFAQADEYDPTADFKRLIELDKAEFNKIKAKRWRTRAWYCALHKPLNQARASGTFIVETIPVGGLVQVMVDLGKAVSFDDKSMDRQVARIKADYANDHGKVITNKEAFTIYVANALGGGFLQTLADGFDTIAVNDPTYVPTASYSKTADIVFHTIPEGQRKCLEARRKYNIVEHVVAYHKTIEGDSKAENQVSQSELLKDSLNVKLALSDTLKKALED